MRFWLRMATLLLMSPFSAVAQESGNVSEGYKLARDVCAVCHAVDDGYLVSPNPDATPFEVVANMPEMTALALAVWFRSPHPSMPDLILTDRETDNIIAYIQSLRD